ncbi:MAG TPA: alpha/beta hydrolase [Bryobacteraceae bacterium]|nr:alpha/beta hydrolase [Bryobacteraceae bacterium]
MPRIPLHIGWPIALVLACGALYYLANRALYYPVKFPQGWWDQQSQVGATDVWLEAQDGVRLHAWWVAASGSRLATLFLHGNAGNVTHRIDHIREIVAAGSSVLMLDYRGYGKSGGRPTEKGLYQDSEAGYINLLERGYRAQQIVLHGESLGCAVAIDLAYRRPCAGLVLEAPFSSASDVAATVVPLLGPALVRSYNSVPKIRWLLMPKLFVQGDRDEIIPPRLGQSLYAAAQAPKSLWIVEGAGHNNILETAGPAYRERLQSFYARLLTAPPPRNRMRPR